VRPKRIPRRPAEPPAPREQREDVPHPRSIRALDRAACLRIAPREERRRKMECELQIAVELLAQRCGKRPIGVKTRDFVFILVRHQLE
jgi:hypothetical protein